MHHFRHIFLPLLFVVPNAALVELHGAGTTNPSKFFWDVIDQFQCGARAPVHMTYRAVGSSTGQKEFVEDVNDFGAGDIPMSKERYDDSKRPSMVHIPIVVGGIGIFHSIPKDKLTSALHLTPCVLAKIFASKIKTWDDKEITELNSDFTPPADEKIIVVHRLKGSSSTSGTTEYLKKSCPEEWTLGTGSTITWGETAHPAEGSGGVAGKIRETPWSIGYLDAGHGHDEGFAEVSLQNKAGKYVDSRSADISAAAKHAVSDQVLPADASADYSAVNLLNLPGEKTWPITMMTYFYVKKDLSAMDVQTANLLRFFLTYVTTLEPGQNLAETYKFVKLPSEVVDMNKNTIDHVIAWPGAPKYVFETSTNVITGAGDYVISSKRRCMGEVQRESLNKKLLEVEKGKAGGDVGGGDKVVEGGGDKGVQGASTTEDNDKTPLIIAIIAIVVAILAAIIATVAFFVKTGKREPKNNTHYTYNPPAVQSNRAGGISQSPSGTTHPVQVPSTSTRPTALSDRQQTNGL